MEGTTNGVVVPQIEQQPQQQKAKKKSKNHNKKSQLTTTIQNNKQISSSSSSQKNIITSAVVDQVVAAAVKTQTRDDCKSVNGLANKLLDVHVTAGNNNNNNNNNGIGTEHHMSNGSYLNDAKHRNLNGHATTSNHTLNNNNDCEKLQNDTKTATTTTTAQSNNNNGVAARKAKSKSKLKQQLSNNLELQAKENTHCQLQQKEDEQQQTNNGIEKNGYAFSKIDIKTDIESLLEEASCSSKSCCINNNNHNSSSNSMEAVERLVNLSTATPTVLTAITAKQKDVTNALIENNQNNQISEKEKSPSLLTSAASSTEVDAKNAEKAISSSSSAALVKEVPALDKSKVHIEYTEYQSELQMHDIMRLIQDELSEPYSIYTYRYFIYNWPKLCFLAAHDNQYVGTIVCKLDMHMNVKRGYIAMLAVRKEYRNLKIGTTLVQMAIEAMLADNADEVVLETEMRNYPALHLYENLGFVRDKRLFRYYLNGVDALRLKLWFR